MVLTTVIISTNIIMRRFLCFQFKKKVYVHLYHYSFVPLHQITRKLVNAAVNVFLIHTAGDGKVDIFPSSDSLYF